MVKFIIKYRWYIACFFVASGIITGSLMPLLQTDPEIRNYIPAEMNSKMRTDSIESEFGVQDIIMIIFVDSSIFTGENLQRIKEIDRGISRLNGVSRQISPFSLKTIRSEDGSMIVEKLIDHIPDDSLETEQLSRNVSQNSFAREVVFSSDMSSAAITAFIDKFPSESVILSAVDSVISAHPGNAQVITGGLPYIRRHIMADVRKDAVFLVPAALMVMLFVLKLSLKDWKSVTLPFTVVVISTVVTLGMIPVLGWKLSLMTLLAPIILIAVANNYGIYIIARYQEISLTDREISGQELIGKLIASLKMPVLFSGLTTIAGILGLLSHAIIAARQVGILAATGVSLALLMSLLFIPAIIFMRKKYTATWSREKNDLFRSISLKMARMVTGNPGKIFALSILVIVLVSTGIIFLRIDTNQENYFPHNHPVRIASEIINKDFGGTQSISVMVKGDIKNPEVMKGIDNITREMENEEGAGGVFSISKVVREMTMAIFDRTENGYDAIPETRDAIAQMFELYYMSGEPDDFSHIINPGNTSTQILIRLDNPENLIVRNIRAKLDKIRNSFPAEMITGGYAVIMSDFAELVIRGQVYSLLFALVTVWLLLSLIFRSVKGGFTGSIPLIASIIVLFGFMGLSGIAIDAATALLSSIMIGVGVDFTIQYIWCFNSFVRAGSAYEDAVYKAHGTIGRSIIINALSVMAGFSILIFSGFTSIRFFGYLVLISISSCLFGALLFIPAILIKFKPGFAARKFLKSKIE